jgi:hypothetical protein
VIGSLTVGGAVAVIASVQAQPRESPTVDAAASIADEPAPTPVASEERHDDEAEAIVIEAKPTRAKHGREDIPDRVSSSEALAILEQARAAMKAGDVAVTLALIEGQPGWPAALDAHRVALEIGALCRIGESQRARARAHAWKQTHEDDSTAVSLVPPCWNDDNTSPEGGHPIVEE